MSLYNAKIKGSLKDQLLQDEKDLKAELEAVQKEKVKAAKKEKAKKNTEPV